MTDTETPEGQVLTGLAQAAEEELAAYLALPVRRQRKGEIDRLTTRRDTLSAALAAVRAATISTEEIAALRGYEGELRQRLDLASTWIRQTRTSDGRKLAPVGRQPGRSGQNLYPRVDVVDAHESSPGPGRWAASRKSQVDTHR